MPAAITSADASPFVICTMDGPLHSSPAKPSKDHGRASSPCVFAASIHAATPTADTVALTPSSIAAPVRFATSHDFMVVQANFRPNTARAPPASV
jgi:hypothetical protein